MISLGEKYRRFRYFSDNESIFDTLASTVRLLASRRRNYSPCLRHEIITWMVHNYEKRRYIRAGETVSVSDTCVAICSSRLSSTELWVKLKYFDRDWLTRRYHLGIDSPSLLDALLFPSLPPSLSSAYLASYL